MRNISKALVALATVAALALPSAASAAPTHTFNGSCVGGGLGSNPSFFTLSCTGALDGAASRSYFSTLASPLPGLAVPLPVSKQGLIPQSIVVLGTGPAVLRLQVSGPGQPLVVAPIAMNGLHTLTGYVYTGASSGFGYGYGTLGPLGDTALNLSFSNIAG